MNKPKLTKAAIAALRAMPFKTSLWNGQIISLLPRGVRLNTLEALRRRGLAGTTREDGPFQETWRITDAGRAALREAGE